MNHTAMRVWVGITWIVTLGIAYLVGWYKGIKSAAHVATGAAHSGFNIVLVVLVVVALCSAVAALRARKYFAGHSAHPTT